ncbi:MAG: M48 family metalloprotease [Acidobacteria bacterium]|nr:M48 family metalloprotease [Acidobacteriota bacterium]
MRTRRIWNPLLSLAMALGLALPVVVPAQSGAQTSGSKSASAESLDDKENPLLIGKRDINKRQMNFYSLERETNLGRQLAAQIDQEMKMVEDPIINEYVNRVGQNIVLHSDAKVPFTIKVAISDEVNAFALPGGFFYVNTGLMLAADNESELAGVMAHEIAHVAARHALENFTKGELLQIFSIPLIFVGGGIGTLARLGANFGLPVAFLKFSRGAEKEADVLGAQYSWASGYDPNGLLTFFEKLQAKNRKAPGGISKLFMSHPSTPDRIEVVKGLIGRFPDRDEYIISSWEFNRVKDRLAKLQGVARRLDKTAGTQGTGRPTLRRKSPSGDGQTTDTDQQGQEKTSDQQSEQKEKPTLKRRSP